MYDAIFFDLDGTLIDTESLALRTGLAAFAAHGHAVDAGFMHGLVGKDEPTAASLIRAALPDVDLTAVNQHWRKGFNDGVETGLEMKHGARDLLARLMQPLAIVTSTGRAGAHRKLGLSGIAGSFTHVVTLDDVQSPKPDPEPYLLAASLFGLAPSRCLVFEDSETGAESAWRAGCIVVQVPDVVPSEGRWAHHLAPDLMTGARMAGLL
jgi:HAD superfamily hydrolase (TIGR01509 family)